MGRPTYRKNEEHVRSRLDGAEGQNIYKNAFQSSACVGLP